jgi:hypothetical protein
MNVLFIMHQKYGIIILNKGTTLVKRLLDQYEFIIDEDFRLSKVTESASNGRMYT